MQKRNVYARLVDTALAIPKHEPPKYEPVPKETIVRRITKKRNARRDVESVYNVIVATTRGRTSISKGVPVSKLNEAMALHVSKFTHEAITRGRLPLKVFVFDRFAAWLDWGYGRYLKISVHIDEKPAARSTARFVVEPATESDFTDYLEAVGK